MALSGAGVRLMNTKTVTTVLVDRYYYRFGKEHKMLKELLHNLTPLHRKTLLSFGIGSERLSEWRSGKRLPTELQVAYLAYATGANWARLQQEVTLERAPANQKFTVARAIGAAQNRSLLAHPLHNPPSCGLRNMKAPSCCRNGQPAPNRRSQSRLTRWTETARTAHAYAALTGRALASH